MSLRGTRNLPDFVKRASWTAGSRERPAPSGVRVINNAQLVSLGKFVWGLAARGSGLGLAAATYKQSGKYTYVTLYYRRGAEHAIPLASLKDVFSKTARHLSVYRNPDNSLVVIGSIATKAAPRSTLTKNGETLELFTKERHHIMARAL